MPSGFTAKIEEGISFKEYALSCARNFGALIMMRDEPMDAPIPDKFKKDSYYQKSLEKAQNQLKKYQSFTLNDWRGEFEAYQVKTVERYLEQIEKNKNLRQKYENMLAKVREYEAPSPDHVNYKKFMETQILESIEFDCMGDYYERELKELGRTHWREYKDQMLGGAERNISCYQEQIDKDEERGEDRNEWIRLLKESLESVE